ncbi:hypothetical protein J1777_00880 [Comamonas denitrificans]|jgi:hypothetical protein|uniref:Uncharacterized protein n=2 Tax=Comamonas TaxID=283 RepID=A0A6N1WY56_9BURK|nr:MULTISPECIES: hypothetical protein [Comamonas]MBO1248394.1 hypothetical protein [Comamonas denitrificans]MBP8183116.1 hypothetical protein [Rhodoferax sp.]MDE1556701.1 hypothetical protein [Comamonas aquatica]QKV51907.1 hypothetical protein HUK68_02760 [Comamonas antarctica]
MVAILKSLAWPETLAVTLPGVAGLERPAEQQESTLVEVLVSGFMA